MKRKTRLPKRIIAFLLLPLFAIVSTTLAFGLYQNYITFNLGLSPAQKPTIMISCTLPNAPENSVTLFVNETTKNIEATAPASLLIYINITNTGGTPIERITLNNTIPNNWTLQQTYMQLIQADQTQTDINSSYFTIEYYTENSIIITTSNIRKTLGKALNQNESIIIGMQLEYAIAGQPLPAEYETNPPTYTNIAAAAVWIGSWQSEFTITTTTFTSYIYWL